jgi:NDP-sugar pyrophosphorylase family protein
MERERITISIKKNLLKEIDGTIDGIKVRNRSHAIETLATLALNLGETKNAILLLGGKDALKLIPTAKENLKLLKKYGFSTVYIAIGYLGDKIIQKLGDGKELGLNLKYIEGEGSGGAIKQLKKAFDKTFIVVNTDEVLKVDIEKLIAFHRKHKVVGTIATGSLLGLEGAYILEPEIFNNLPNGFSMVETDIFPKLLKEEGIAIYPIV